MDALDRVYLRRGITLRDLKGRSPSLFSTCAKHPKLEAILEENIGLIFWVDKRLRKWLDPHHQWPFYYLCSFVVDALNFCLYSYNPEKAQLSTYLYFTCLQYVHPEFLRFESEYWQKRHYKSTADPEDQHDTKVNYAYHEFDFVLYRMPEADLDWAQEILSLFSSYQAAWDFFTKRLGLRAKNILERRFRFGHTLEAIAIDEKISKERVRQIQAVALKKVRQTLLEAEKLVDQIRAMNIEIPQFSEADTKPIRIYPRRVF